jgi:hypothetical protein
MKDGLLGGSQHGTLASCDTSGWKETEMFVEWMNHFVQCVIPTEEKPVPLLLDEHSSHKISVKLI